MTIEKNALERFGIRYLRPYQELIISHILSGGKNLLAVLPTGSGKSLCFMLPAALMRKRSLILYPLLSLMNDQKARFDKASINSVILSGGLDHEERRRRINKALSEEDCAIIANPETLLAMKERGELQRFRKKIGMFVVDEVHTVVTWGESFRPALKEIAGLNEYLSPDVLLAFTATMDREIGKGIISTLFHGKYPYIVKSTMDRENIFYHCIRPLSAKHETIELLRAEDSRPAIIFTRSRKLTEIIAGELKHIFCIKHYNAGLSKEEKKEKENWFHSSSDGILVSTSAYGMGVDKPDIRTVIHIGTPADAAEYMQEAGRGGRDGRICNAYVLALPSDNTPLTPVFTGKECIRSSLLKLMGEERDEKMCLGCSNCIKETGNRAGEKEILEAVRRIPFRKAESIASSLTARHIFFRSKRLIEWSGEEVASAIEILIEEKKIKAIHGHLYVT